VPAWEIETLADHVKAEPRAALCGGEDGLDFYRSIIGGVPMYLKNGGQLIMELGYGQSGKVKRMLDTRGGFSEIEFIKDLSNIDRVVKARWTSS
jgi:release factor glutamine methyltransferase